MITRDLECPWRDNLQLDDVDLVPGADFENSL